MKILLIAISLIFTSLANAHLVESAEDIILNESQDPVLVCPENDPVFVDFFCKNTELTISAIGPSGDESQDRLFATNALDCKKNSDEMVQAVGYEITQPRIFAVCNNSRLQRRMIRMDGSIKALSDTYLSNALDCRQKASEINTRP